MSDKNKISLEDRGWAEMSVVLDRELPQKKRKKKTIFWFFLIGGAFLALAFLMQDNKSPDVFSKDKIASLNSVSKQEIKEKQIDQNKVTDVDENLTYSQTTKNNTYSIQPQTREIKNYSETNISSKEENIIKSKRQIIQNLNSSKKPSNSPAIVNPISEEPEYNILSIEEKGDDVVRFLNFNNSKKVQNTIAGDENKSPEREKFLIDLIPTEMSKLDLNNAIKAESLFVTASQNPITSIKVEKDRKNYLFAGGHVALNPSGLGYNLGIGRKFSTDKFNFFLEAGYSSTKYRNNFSGSNLVLVDLNPDQNSTSGSFESDYKDVIEEVIVENQTEIYNLLSQVNSISFTAGLEKQLLKNMSLSGGLSYARLLNVENQEVTYQSSTGFLQNELDVYNISKSTILDSEIFNKNEFSIKFGMGYYVTAKFKLSLNYEFGITNLISSSPSYLSDLNIGVSSESDLPYRPDNYNSTPLRRRSIQFKMYYMF